MKTVLNLIIIALVSLNLQVYGVFSVNTLVASGGTALKCSSLSNCGGAAGCDGPGRVYGCDLECEGGGEVKCGPGGVIVQ